MEIYLPQHSDDTSGELCSTLAEPLPREGIRASEIIREYGRTSLDALKLWPAKRYFFSQSRCSLVAYKVERGAAIALGDPVGPEWELQSVIRGFLRHCQTQGWAPAFYRTGPDCLPVYQQLGFNKLKIGEDAIVELSRFSLTGKSKRDIRSKARQFEILGMKVIEHEPPLSSALLGQLQQVSDEWLQIPGRRERSFAVGYFDRDYLRSTPVLAATDIEGRVQAFINVRYSNVEMTGDLMRRRKDVPNGIMDYLFLNFLRLAQTLGYARVNLGLAPMTGFRAGECSTIEERLIHAFLKRLGFLFNFHGLRHYKAKFATSWEPRFLVYRSTFQLPRIALAFHRLARVKPPAKIQRLSEEHLAYGSQ